MIIFVSEHESIKSDKDVWLYLANEELLLVLELRYTFLQFRYIRTDAPDVFFRSSLEQILHLSDVDRIGSLKSTTMSLFRLTQVQIGNSRRCIAPLVSSGTRSSMLSSTVVDVTRCSWGRIFVVLIGAVP